MHQKLSMSYQSLYNYIRYNTYLKPMGICGEKVQPPTPEAARYVLILKILVIPQLAVSVIAFVAHAAFLKQAIFALFFLLLIFAGFYKLSHQAMMIYVFMGLFFIITFLIYIFTRVQQGVNVNGLQSDEKYNFIVAIISTIFYFFISVFGFYPYREFKAIQYIQNPALADFMMHRIDDKEEVTKQKKSSSKRDSKRNDSKRNKKEKKRDEPVNQKYFQNNDPVDYQNAAGGSNNIFIGRGTRVG